MVRLTYNLLHSPRHLPGQRFPWEQALGSFNLLFFSALTHPKPCWIPFCQAHILLLYFLTELSLSLSLLIFPSLSRSLYFSASLSHSFPHSPSASLFISLFQFLSHIVVCSLSLSPPLPLPIISSLLFAQLSPLTPFSLSLSLSLWVRVNLLLSLSSSLCLYVHDIHAYSMNIHTLVSMCVHIRACIHA